MYYGKQCTCHVVGFGYISQKLINKWLQIIKDYFASSSDSFQFFPY